MKGRFPPQNCKDYNEEYENRRESWKVDAIHEYIKNTKLLEVSNQVFFTGPFQCFCKAE